MQDSCRTWRSSRASSPASSAPTPTSRLRSDLTVRPVGSVRPTPHRSETRQQAPTARPRRRHRNQSSQRRRTASHVHQPQPRLPTQHQRLVRTRCSTIAAMKRTVGAALILLTFTATACSGSKPARSWSEFESCAIAFDNGFTYPVYTFRGFVEDYRNGDFEERRSEEFDRGVVACEKVMPFTD